jgi:hypothetical protein
MTFEQPERGVGICDDARCAAGSAKHCSELFECCGTISELFENPQLARNEQVFGAHKTCSQIEN